MQLNHAIPVVGKMLMQRLERTARLGYKLPSAHGLKDALTQETVALWTGVWNHLPEVEQMADRLESLPLPEGAGAEEMEME